ncbi:MAG: thioredoxin fold domain-containing protein [Gammaproteobacteria bacterium]|nr:thioredoxin fold domain-containing protein [Gammaproteobacteria bacterium]MDH5801263.1 thioredoxin fold domain-containing protein [Gammaproteobacteria bacterium]
MSITLRNLGMGILILCFTHSVWAKKEGELNPDLTNPGFVEFPAWFKVSFLDFNEDSDEASQASKYLLVFFYQDGCPYCRKTIEVNFAQKAIEDKTRAHFDVVAVNMWGDRELTWLDGESMTEKQLAEKMRVMFTPTLIFVDKDKKTALRINGYYHPQKFSAALDYVRQGQYLKTGFRQYWNQLSPSPSAGKLHAQTFIVKPPYDFSKTSKTPRLVLFEQKDCPACDELHTDVFKRKETLQQLKPFSVSQLDMWSNTPVVTPEGKKTTAKQWAKQLQVKYAPSLVFFDSQGKEIIRTEAYFKSFHLQSVMEYVSSGKYKTISSFQRYIDERADALRAKGVAIDLMR